MSATDRKTMTRQETLLHEAAKAFFDGRSVDGHFLAENDVTADECFDLSDSIGWAIEIYARMPPAEKAANLGRAAASIPDGVIT